MRLLAAVVVSLLSNAIGLLVAAALLDDLTLDAAAFLIDVAIFTATSVVILPLLQKAALTRQSALMGGTALFASFLALVVTDLVSDGLSITGLTTWVFAAVIVWGASLLAALLLPMLIFKKTLQARRS